MTMKTWNNSQTTFDKYKVKGDIFRVKNLGNMWSIEFTDVHVRIFWCSYSDTSYDFTREIEEEKMEF